MKTCKLTCALPTRGCFQIAQCRKRPRGAGSVEGAHGAGGGSGAAPRAEGRGHPLPHLELVGCASAGSVLNHFIVVAEAGGEER